MRIYPVKVKPPSAISTWEGWPDEVREVIRRWNKRIWIRLSFVRSPYTFKCADCGAFCQAHPNGAAVFCRNTDLWLCDDCLIIRARRYLPIFNELAAHRRAGRIQQSCICPMPARKPESGYDWKIDPACPYHRLAAEFPHDHSIPWNCPSFYDGCNCIGGE